MSDLASLMKQVDVQWDVEEWNRLLADTERRGRVRSRRRRLAAATMAVLLIGGGGSWMTWREVRSRDVARVVPESAASPSGPVVVASSETVSGAGLRTVRFGDGSTVTLLNSASTLGPREVTSKRTEIDLLSGSARFEVARAPERTFRVSSGSVWVEVLGTAFTLDRVSEGGQDRTRVSVEHGTVKVGWGGGQAEVKAGQTETFPPARPEVTPAQPSDTKNGRPSAGASSWRRYAHDKDFDRAFQEMETAGAAVRDEPGDLLLAADVARLSGHPAKAVPYLRKVVARYPGDQRAAASAFTLGRVLLEDLRAPAAAADAFEKARTLAPDGILAEDALVRRIEALVAADDRAAASALAERYRKDYPQGRRRRSIERIVGSE